MSECHQTAKEKACRGQQKGLQGHKKDHGKPCSRSFAKALKGNTELTEGNSKFCNKHKSQQQEAHRRSELANYNQGVQLCVVDDHADTGM